MVRGWGGDGKRNDARATDFREREDTLSRQAPLPSMLDRNAVGGEHVAQQNVGAFCARATSGHATADAAPPKSVMNSRRFN